MFWDVLSVFLFFCGGGVGTVGDTKFLWVDFCHLGLVASPVFLVPNGSTNFSYNFAGRETFAGEPGWDLECHLDCQASDFR